MIRLLIFLIGIIPGVLALADKPNFIVILTDDQRVDTLGCYSANCPIDTPNLNRLANQGIRFSNGYVTTPICVASRASIQTGRYESNSRLHQFNTSMADDVFDQSYPVYLRNAGYFVGHFGKYGVGITDRQTETFNLFEGQSNQGPQFREYKGRMLHDSEWLTEKTRDFLDAVPKGMPFCLQLSYKAPHSSSVPAPEDDSLLDDYNFERSPWDTPEEYAKLPEYVQKGYGRRCYNAMFNGKEGHNPYMRQYFEKIVSVERSVGKIMEMLENRGLASNTVIIFLSDHGTHFGEKQLGGKWTPYDQSLRIPFIIYDPRPEALRGAIRDEMVLNIDVAPTLLDMAGIPVPEIMDGMSLMPLINGPGLSGEALGSKHDPPWRNYFAFEHFTSPAPVLYIPRNDGIRYEDLKYVRWFDQDPIVEELYDLGKDPMETNNLVQNPEYREKLETARARYNKWRQENPSTYEYDSYGQRPQYGAQEIDWQRFRAVYPEEYGKIEAEVNRLGVTWEQAINDWDIRYEICSKAGYWY